MDAIPLSGDHRESRGQRHTGSARSTRRREGSSPAQTLVTYSPPGYLLFARDRTLVAQPFDAKALETRGEPVPLAEKIGTDNVGLARFSVSRNGVLVYRTAQSAGRLLWRDRTGRELDSPGDPGVYNNPAISPTGDRLARQPRRPSDRQAGHLGPGSRPRRRVAVQSGPGRQLQGRLVSRRGLDRLRFGPGRESRHLRKIHAGTVRGEADLSQ